MRNFKNLMNKNHQVINDDVVSRRIITPRNNTRSIRHNNQIDTINSAIKTAEDKEIMKWEESNINYNKPVMTVGIMTHDMSEHLWLAMESLKNQTNVVFSWELIVIEEGSASRDTVTSYIGKLPGCVRILYKLILPGSGQFDDAILERENIGGKYTSMEKFVDIMNLADEESIIFVKQDANSYSPHNRLYNHYMHFKDRECAVSCQIKGHLYNITNNNFTTYDSKKVEPYIWDSRTHELTGITLRPVHNNNSDIETRYTHLNAAFRLNILRNIPVLSRPIHDKDISDVMFSAILAKTNKRPEETSIIRHCKETDSSGWDTGICIIESLSDVHLKCISKEFDNNISDVPDYIIDRLHSLHFQNASNELLKELTHLQNIRDQERAKMELQEKKQNDILNREKELTKILEARVDEEKKLINQHIEEQVRIKKQKQALDYVSSYRIKQESELIKQNENLRQHLEIEAKRMKEDTESLSRRMEELKKEKIKEENLIQKKVDKIEKIKEENIKLENARAKRILEESKLEKDVDSLRLITEDDIKEAEKSANELREKIKELEKQQELEKQALKRHEGEYNELKKHQDKFETEQKARAKQEHIVMKEREKLHAKLNENAIRIQQDADSMNVKLKEVQDQKLIENKSITKKKMEKDKIFKTRKRNGEDVKYAREAGRVIVNSRERKNITTQKRP